MATAGELIQDTLSELTVAAQGESLPAIDINTGIRYLNRMMQAFDADGVKLGYTIVSAPNDSLTVPDGALEAMMFNLGLRMANGYDVDVSPAFAQSARESKKILYKLGVSFGKQNYPSSLPIGSGNEQENAIYADQRFFDGCCEDVDHCEDKS